jgi:hypothetical protein
MHPICVPPDYLQNPKSTRKAPSSVSMGRAQIASGRPLQPSNRRARPGMPPKLIACFRRPSAPADLVVNEVQKPASYFKSESDRAAN